MVTQNPSNVEISEGIFIHNHDNGTVIAPYYYWRRQLRQLFQVWLYYRFQGPDTVPVQPVQP